MKTSSAKQKGRLGQQQVAKAILDHFPALTERDVRSTPMGCTGSDLTLSERAIQDFPFDVEVKVQESLGIWGALEQVIKRCAVGLYPILFFKRNRTDMFCAMKMDDFMKIVKVYSTWVTSMKEKVNDLH